MERSSSVSSEIYEMPSYVKEVPFFIDELPSPSPSPPPSQSEEVPPPSQSEQAPPPSQSEEEAPPPSPYYDKSQDLSHVENVRRMAIYSEDGQESMNLTSYTLSDGTQRIMLNDIDLTLTDFRRYLNCLTKTNENRDDELFFVGIHASFITGLVVLLVAFGLTLINFSVSKN